jgi:signal transduction histidine kinase/ligand-binding sensor domain-containing protein
MKIFMNSVKTRIAVAICLIWLLPVTVYSQSGNEIYRHLSTRDGLSSNFIWKMMQDSKGYIWIAGAGGPARYDSYNITSFIHDPEDEASYSGGASFSFFEDNSGFIWIGSSSGISLYSDVTGTFTQLQTSESVPAPIGVREIIRADDQSIWAAGVGGLHRILPAGSEPGMFHAEFFSLDDVPDESIAIWTIQQGPDGTLWLGTTHGVYMFDTDTNTYEKLPSFGEETDMVLNNQIWQILRDSKNHLWFTSDGGLALWKEGFPEPERVTVLGDSEINLEGEMIQSVSEDNVGNIWIATAYIGALRYHPETGDVQPFRRSSNTQNSILEDDIHYVFVDSDDNVWFGYHDFGVSVMYTQPWDYTYSLLPVSNDPEHPVNQIRGISDDEAGNLWMATGAGLVRYSPENHSMDLFVPDSRDSSPDNEENIVAGLLIDKGKILVKTLRNFFYEFDIDTEQFTMIEFPETVSQFSPLLMKSNTSDDTHYFIGTWGHEKLYLVNKETLLVAELQLPRRDPDSSIDRAIIPLTSPDGTVYIKFDYNYQGQINGDLFLFDPETVSVSQIDLDYPDNITTYTPPAFSKTEEGIYWILTNQGLLRRDIVNGTNQFLFRNEAGVLGESNGRITEDDQGNLWIGAASRVYKLDPASENLTVFEAVPGRKPGIFGVPGLLHNGDIVFSGPGGFVRFNPETQDEPGVIQHVHITELKAGTDTYRTSIPEEKYDIDYSNNNISVSFHALNYRDPSATRYRYRLSGYMDDWSEIGVQRSVYLANLPPGNYTFEVQAAQNFGSYSETTAGLNISILPPWWRTMPAYLFFALLFAGGVFTIDRVQRRRVIRTEREMARENELAQAKEIEKAYEHLKAAQEQLVQQEKLASLGQLTAGIAHEIKNPLNFVNNFSEVSREMIQELREEMTEFLDEIGLNNKSSQLTGKQIKSAELILELLDEIESNQVKVNEHGKRADGIVKSMLQHSRGGSGEIKPTNLNSLIKEYVNLAFHGMRAGKDPINVDIDLQLDESIREVPLIGEDFSRVILNLCNNAFDAMRDKLTGDGGPKTGYVPKLTVRTKSDNGKVTIEIEDNGPGIPDEIKDKILQPFFTTKKGTQGTGLGLSITNDIIKAHGGNLDIQTKPGQTVFTIYINA